MTNEPQDENRLARAQIDRNALAMALALLGLAAIGILHGLYGTWRPGPGGGPWLVPMLVYFTLIGSGAVMLVAAFGGAGVRATAERAAFLPIIVTAIWSIGLFYAVRKLGLFTGSTLGVGLAMIALSPNPLKALKVVVPLAVVVGIAFYLMFTRVAPILQGRPWLF